MSGVPPTAGDSAGGALPSLAGQRVTVMGLGRFGGGLGVTQFLLQHGARVLLTDMQPAEKLGESLAALEPASGPGTLALRLGEHREQDFAQADLVVANPAVKPGNPHLQAARAAGVRVTTEIRLLVERLPRRLRTIGVTGSAGKSTVTAMIGHVLERATDRPVWVGGNLGGSLLAKLDEIGPDDWVVLELSSFMLHYLRADDASHTPGWSPHIAVVTNLSPNHLDWHGTLEAYAADKQVILDYQQLDADDAAVGGPGVHEQFSPRVTRWQDFGSAGDRWWKLDPPIPLLTPGEHNQLNARLAAATVHQAIGLDEWRSFELLADFAGLPHRLQFVGEWGGVRFFNDSKSTTPEAARLAIESFEPGRTHIILGGYDKGSDLTPLAQFAASRCRSVLTVGATGPTIASAARTAGGAASVLEAGTLDAAVQAATERADAGDVVLLSPGCASWDQFEHFEQRGEAFLAAVHRCTSGA